MWGGCSPQKQRPRLLAPLCFFPPPSRSLSLLLFFFGNEWKSVDRVPSLGKYYSSHRPHKESSVKTKPQRYLSIFPSKLQQVDCGPPVSLSVCLSVRPRSPKLFFFVKCRSALKTWTHWTFHVVFKLVDRQTDRQARSPFHITPS